MIVGVRTEDRGGGEFWLMEGGCGVGGEMVEVVRGARFGTARRETWEEDLKAPVEEGTKRGERKFELRK